MTAAPGNDDDGVLYCGGTIRTIDPARPTAEAVATRHGRILAVGSEEACRQALGFDGHTDRIVDLAGRTLLPGFNDAHLYPMAACFFTYHLDLGGVTTIDEALGTLGERARATPPGEWVIGLRLSADQVEEKRLPHLTELDAVGGGRPVILLLGDGHTSVGNSVALAAAGIRDRRPPPAGGSFGYDGQGRLTGVCHENATGTLLSAVPMPDPDELALVAKRFFADLATRGLTSVGVGLQTDAEGPGGPAAALESIGMMLVADQIPQGVHTMLCGQPGKVADLRSSSVLHRPERNLYVGGVRILLDGTLSARTAYLHQPYADGPPDNVGYLRMDVDEAAGRMKAAHRAGLQICLHAIGDAATDRALDLFAELLDHHPSDGGEQPRHRIEHATMISPGAAERFAASGIVAVVQPTFLRRADRWLPDRLGPERLDRAFPFRTLVDAGVVVAGSSNAPVEPSDPLAGIAAAVTRHGFAPHEALRPEDAIALYTRNPAIAQRRDHEIGTITEGKQADLVILSDDPVTVPGAQIADLRVIRTVVAGRTVHQAGE